MNPDLCILQLLHWPGCLTVRQTADALGVRQQAIPILAKAKVLKPLGAPAPNGEKLFSAVEVRRLSEDPAALHKAVRVLQEHWKRRNQKYALDNCRSSEPKARHAA